MTTPAPIKRITFQVESDWHLEHQGGTYDTWDKDFSPNNGADILLLAGDCVSVREEHLEKYEAILTRLATRYKAILLVSGNNELKGNKTLDVSMARLEDMEKQGGRIWVLEKKALRLDGVTVLGCTLWTCIRDDAARTSGDLAQWPGEVNIAHNTRYAESLEWLREAVARVRRVRPDDRIVILVSTFFSCLVSIALLRTSFRAHLLNYFLGRRLVQIINPYRPITLPLYEDLQIQVESTKEAQLRVWHSAATKMTYSEVKALRPSRGRSLGLWSYPLFMLI